MNNDVLPNVPAKITVSFPRLTFGSFNDERYSLTIALADLALTQYSDFVGHEGTHLIRSTVLASVTNSYAASLANINSPPPPGGTWIALGYIDPTAQDWDSTKNYIIGDKTIAPDNLIQLIVLAKQIAKDWYLWKLAASLELRLPSFITRHADGAHDFEYWGSGTETTVVHRSGWESDCGVEKNPPAQSCYHLALTLTDITARVGSTFGNGLIEYYTSVLGVATATGIKVTALNKCDLIAAGNLVSAFREPFSNIDFVEDPCAFTPDDSAWYCLEDPVSTPCCDGLTTDLPFVWNTTFPLLQNTVVSGTMVYNNPIVGGWYFFGSGGDPITGAGYNLQLELFCDEDSGTLVVIASLQYGGSAPSIDLAIGTYVPTNTIDCGDFCFQATAPAGMNLGTTVYSSSIAIGDCCLVTVTLNTADLAANATTITINGTGFDGSVPGNNIVTFDNATGICTSSTTTSLVVTFTRFANVLGPLKAVVTVGLCSSYPPVQVATVVVVRLTGGVDCDHAAYLSDIGTTYSAIILDGDTAWFYMDTIPSGPPRYCLITVLSGTMDATSYEAISAICTTKTMVHTETGVTTSACFGITPSENSLMFAITAVGGDLSITLAPSEVAC